MPVLSLSLSCSAVEGYIYMLYATSERLTLPEPSSQPPQPFSNPPQLVATDIFTACVLSECTAPCCANHDCQTSSQNRLHVVTPCDPIIHSVSLQSQDTLHIEIQMSKTMTGEGTSLQAPRAATLHIILNCYLVGSSYVDTPVA